MGIEHDLHPIEAGERYSYSTAVTLGKDGVPITLHTNSQAFQEYLESGVFGRGERGDVCGQNTHRAILVESAETSIDYDEAERTMVISGKPDQIADSLVYMLYTYSEVQRQAEDRYTLHAAAVCKEGQGILILGSKGAGKTALAMSLCVDWGYDLIGNDVVIVGRSAAGGFQIYGGDGVFKPRRLTMDEFPQFRDIVPFDVEKNDFEAKAIVHPNELGVSVEDGSVSFVSAVQVFMHADKNTALRVTEPPYEALRLNLYENASRYIRGVTTPVFDSEGRFMCSLPSFDNHDLSCGRICFLEQVIENIGVVSVSGGNLREVSEYVKNQR